MKLLELLEFTDGMGNRYTLPCDKIIDAEITTYTPIIESLSRPMVLEGDCYITLTLRAKTEDEFNDLQAYWGMFGLQEFWVDHIGTPGRIEVYVKAWLSSEEALRVSGLLAVHRDCRRYPKNWKNRRG